jgi:hypothetical protein
MARVPVHAESVKALSFAKARMDIQIAPGTGIQMRMGIKFTAPITEGKIFKGNERIYS